MRGGRHKEDVFIDKLREVALNVEIFGSKWFKSIDIRSDEQRWRDCSRFSR